MAILFSRKTLSAPGLLRELRSCFDRIEDNITHRGLTLTDCLMSGLAVFGLKYASLLRFDQDTRGNTMIRSNLKSLYGVKQAPSDTALRERLDTWTHRFYDRRSSGCSVCYSEARVWRASPIWTVIT